MPYDETFLIEKLIEYIIEIGKFPTDGEIRLKAYKDKTFPGRTLVSRLGKKLERAKKIAEYCEHQGGLSNVLEICGTVLSQYKKNSNTEIENNTGNFGFVYLMKAGKYYKIGRSNSAGRREYELGTKLPERPQLIHQIKTDDPIGIETYWHNRFKEKRMNGEWFELMSQDVKAFKRRKFM